MKAQTGNTEAFICFLERILQTFPEKLIQLWVDNASWHKGDRIRNFLKLHSQLKLFYHPPYHPELNCQETIWKRIRYEVTTSRYFATLEQLEETLVQTVVAWPNEKVKSFCTAKCKLN